MVTLGLTTAIHTASLPSMTTICCLHCDRGQKSSPIDVKKGSENDVFVNPQHAKWGTCSHPTGYGILLSVAIYLSKRNFVWFNLAAMWYD
jgi:hypothetical protein